MKLIFLYVDKYQTFLQVDLINLGQYGQTCCDIPKKKQGMKLNFCVDEYHNFL